MPSDNLELMKLAAGLYPDELYRECDKERATNFGASDEQIVGNATNRIIVRHAAELHRSFQVAQGRAVNTARLPAAYLDQLRERGATEDTLAEAAERIYGDRLDKAAAIRRWEEAATKVHYDLREGDQDPATFYDPNASRPRESNG
jgi:hypothetical protein